MKKILIKVFSAIMLIAPIALVTSLKGEAALFSYVVTDSDSMSVRATTNPRSDQINVYIYFKAKWDGSYLYILGTGSKTFDSPIVATRTTEFSKFPYCFNYNGKLYYVREW